MINNISAKLTSLIKTNVSGITPEKEEVIDYGLQILLYELVVYPIVFVLAYFLGVFNYFLLAFVVFGVLRVTAGGAHSPSRLECTITFSLTLFGTVFLSKYLGHTSIYPAIAVFFIDLLIAYKYAPGDTTEKPILNRKLKTKLRISAFIFLLATFISAIIICRYNAVTYNVIILSTIPAMFFLTPAGYKLSRCNRSS